MLRVILPGGAVHSVLFGWLLQSLQLLFLLELLCDVYLWCQLSCFMIWIYLMLSLYLGGCCISLLQQVFRWCHLLGSLDVQLW